MEATNQSPSRKSIRAGFTEEENLLVDTFMKAQNDCPESVSFSGSLLQGIKAVLALRSERKEPTPHKWSLDGEKCLVCGASDWMAGDCRPDPTDYKALYHELIYQVGMKHPDETRHQTALRYLKQAENNGGQGCDAAKSATNRQKAQP